MLAEWAGLKIKTIDVLFFDYYAFGPYLRNTLLMEKVETQQEATLEIYKKLRPGDVPSPETAQNFFHSLFFSPETYDLGEVGRVKINHRFQIPFSEVPVSERVLRKEDIMLVVKTLIALKSGYGQVDDIDHLGNRRVRSVGELLENQYRVGLSRMERYIKEKMNIQDAESLMPNDFINVKPLNVVVREFVASGQLSQFMDQTNPLSEITHKRRLSALGPGGLARNRAGFEVRDVHPTHYGRICPIETPDGPNVGLISSLAMFARVNPYGFIETPYFPVKDGKQGKQPSYLSAFEEQGHYIAQAGKGLQGKTLVEQEYTVRRNGDYEVTEKEKVSLMDVSSGQLVSVASSLIPFLEHDDANRALMGANMQRQAVPLMRAKAPLVGTGVERLVARDSGSSLVCTNEGVVESVDALRIVVRRLGTDGSLGKNVDIYDLIKCRRTNQNTCFNHKVIVKKGDRVRPGDILADGPATDKGELAIAQNVVVAFCPWMGYNFEDSILISEKLVKNDYYTSIHIQEFECNARDTKLGQEEITSDIAHIGEAALVDLDSSGVIRIGAEVKPGDILVGKVTPKGSVQLAPEEKLLLAIFGEKACEYQDTSTRVPSGVHGTVVDIQVYNREGVSKDSRLQEIAAEKKARIEKDMATQINALRNTALDQLKDVLVGVKTESVLLSEDGSEELLQEGQVLTGADLESISFPLLAYIPLESQLEAVVSKIMERVKKEEEDIRSIYQEKIQQLHEGDELPVGVVKMVRVYVAIKRKLQVGDKLAGRHGNKGVISRVLPEEDLPYLADGRPVDMILNPLGVPSRMNIGQVLECHFGWAAYGLGQKIQKQLDDFNMSEAKKLMLDIYDSKDNRKVVETADEGSLKEIMKDSSGGVHLATPVFDGASESDVKGLLKKADLDSSGQTVLFDGRTGEVFKCPVTVGVMYMLKLNHLVEEKVHARSIGPYSLVSQQPLGGKSQFGGQRFGEMEVWAIEAYGAAYSLQEFLTVKSDDVAGRIRIYESIIKGENDLEPGLPESFNVLIKELQSLALNVNIIESEALTEAPKPVRMEEEDI